ncbi:L-seryl-tRNA(Sec) kinase isoform X4 [Eptesicus fuscus]|uniref:L-seryl-tRNA(Sec) kinase isoform X4 n=1 Tax=Eptesicus fuscus TaxID=29078 RepID=UPI0024043C1C|nr:L-seryl-tRNA(Sec) kinase isoform X4 [Eptesicus fuscus]
MEAGEDARAARGEGPRRLGLCVLCGLPAAGKSTLARALSHQLRRERRWAVGVVAYDDVMPDAFPEEAAAGPLEGKQCVRAHRPLPPRWKALRRELLTCLEGFLRALLLRGPLSAPPGGTEALWEAFTACLRAQGLLRPAPAPEGPARHLPTPPAEGPLLLVLDDNFYYRSMRHEVYQLARSPELTGLLLAALENPVTCVEDSAEQKEADRAVCSASTLHRADQALRRIVSQTMKEAKDARLRPPDLKLLAEALNQLRAELLRDLRLGGKAPPCSQALGIPDVVALFHEEKDSLVHKYLSEQH